MKFVALSELHTHTHAHTHHLFPTAGLTMTVSEDLILLYVVLFTCSSVSCAKRVCLKRSIHVPLSNNNKELVMANN